MTSGAPSPKSEQMCKTLNDIARAATPPHQVSLPDATDPSGVHVNQSYNVAQYSPMSRKLLEAKIKRYPPGTKFVLLHVWSLTDDQRKLEDETQAIFEKNRMSLGRPTN